MSQLNLFPNFASYQTQTTEKRLKLDAQIYNVEAYDAKTLKNVFVEILEKGDIQVGSWVSVEDGDLSYSGRLLEHDSQFLKIQDRDSNYLVRKPKLIWSSKESFYKFHSQKGKTVLVQGTMDGHWSPQYRIFLGKDPDQIDSLQLVGKIQNIMDLCVDEIIFNTQPVLLKSRQVPGQMEMLSRAEHDSSEHEEPSDTEMVQYRIKPKVPIQSQQTYPLKDLGKFSSKRVYFIRLDQSRPVFGYIFPVQQYWPAGSIQIYDAQRKMIGESFFRVTGSEVFLKLVYESKLISQVVTESEQTGTRDQPQETIHFEARIQSSFSSPVQGIIEYPYRGTLKSAQPEVSQKLPEVLIWEIALFPGENVFSGEIVIQR